MTKIYDYIFTGNIESVYVRNDKLFCARRAHERASVTNQMAGKSIPKWERPRVMVRLPYDLFLRSNELFLERMAMFSAITECNEFDWIVLTDYPQDVPESAPASWLCNGSNCTVGCVKCCGWPKHVAIATTVSTQVQADVFVPFMLQVPAPKRILYMSPLRCMVDLEKSTGTVGDDGAFVLEQAFGNEKSLWACPKCQGTKYFQTDPYVIWCSACNGTGVGIHWVIVGGGNDPMHPDWVRSLHDQCRKRGVPFWFQKWGKWSHHRATHALHVDGRFIKRPKDHEDPRDPVGREDPGWTSIGLNGGNWNDLVHNGRIWIDANKWRELPK